MGFAGRLYSWLMRALVGVTVVILSVLTLAVFVSVVVRYFGLFQGSMPWIDELSRYLSIWLVFLGSAIALEQRKHVAADFLSHLFPTRGRAYLNLAIQVGVLTFLMVLTWEGLGLVLRTTRQLSPALSLPMSHVYLAIPVGGALMIVATLKSALGSLSVLRSQRPADERVPEELSRSN